MYINIWQPFFTKDTKDLTLEVNVSYTRNIKLNHISLITLIVDVITVFLKMAVTVWYCKKINLLFNVDMVFGTYAE